MCKLKEHLKNFETSFALIKGFGIFSEFLSFLLIIRSKSKTKKSIIPISPPVKRMKLTGGSKPISDTHSQTPGAKPQPEANIKLPSKHIKLTEVPTQSEITITLNIISPKSNVESKLPVLTESVSNPISNANSTSNLMGSPISPVKTNSTCKIYFKYYTNF